MVSVAGSVSESRIRTVNDGVPNPDGAFVVYWMVATRRPAWNFALQRAADWARTLGKPLIVLEALRVGYAWASDRLHGFIIQGMADNHGALRPSPVLHYPYLEPEPGAGKGLLAALGRRASVVVTDDFPVFMLPRMVSAAGRQLEVLLEAVDGNGLLPMRSAPKVFSRAYDFRRFLQAELAAHLEEGPDPDPLDGLIPADRGLVDKITERWPAATEQELAAPPLAGLPIDHDVAVSSIPGGRNEGLRRLRSFIQGGFGRYAEERNHPDEVATSGLSPYLHFGHLSVHEILAAIADHEEWHPGLVTGITSGARPGWWGMSESAEAFLDQLVTWRELGFNMAVNREDFDRFESLPDWALQTLAEHAGDPRPYTYDLGEFAAADTHDPVWNAAQRQLATEGVIHNYLRMLWGKKILEWTTSPEEALQVMIELNNRYALDGRDPNSYSGIFWVLGRYDRAWGPERPIYGKVRYMTSEATTRKLRMREYLHRYGDEPVLFD
jgi:deoxyribodipyrimidine photo-lyase